MDPDSLKIECRVNGETRQSSKPPEQRVWLKGGDKIACSLERLGELTFTLT